MGVTGRHLPSHSVMLSICQYGLEKTTIELTNALHGICRCKEAVAAQTGAVC